MRFTAEDTDELGEALRDGQRTRSLFMRFKIDSIERFDK